MTDAKISSGAEVYKQYAHVEQRVGENSSTPEVEYWGLNPPDAIYIASSSVRKLLMADWLLHVDTCKTSQNALSIPLESYFPISSALDLKPWLMEHVHNGDGALGQGEQVFVGYFHGVPIYGISTNGESSRNTTPQIEATAKAIAAAREHGLLGNIVVVSTDAVEQVVSPGSCEKRFLGKPANTPKYQRLHKIEDESEFAEALITFAREYINENFPPHAIVEHTLAMTAVALQSDLIRTKKARLEYEVPEQNREKLELDIYSGGGGLTQQFLAQSEKFKSMSELERFMLICRIMGMPFLAIMELAKAVVLEEGERI